YLNFETSTLLRKPDNRRQHRIQRQLAADVRQHAVDQMRGPRRRAFRGDVSVELTIFAPTLPSPPAVDTSVKAYLDALSGVLWRDDRQVAHLVVHRVATDGPHRRFRFAGQSPIPQSSALKDALWVSVDALPARVYAEHYDRTLDLRDEVEDYYERESGYDRDRATEYWHDAWDLNRDDDELHDLYQERRDEDAGSGIYSISGYEEPSALRDFREQRIAE